LDRQVWRRCAGESSASEARSLADRRGDVGGIWLWKLRYSDFLLSLASLLTGDKIRGHMYLEVLNLVPHDTNR
jgi:hypothetical protein